MTFGEQINAYLMQLGCTAKEFAAAAGVSETQLSRWRSGARRPSDGAVSRLAAGVALLSGGTTEEQEARRALSASLPAGDTRHEGVGERLDVLLSTLNIRTSEVSRSLNFDASYLSRIRAGKRRPSNIAPIVEGVSRFVVRRGLSGVESEKIAALLDVPETTLSDNAAYLAALTEWLYGGKLDAAVSTADVSGFLHMLDEFDINEYLRVFRFEGQSRAEAQAALPVRRSYSGIQEMKEGELTFLRATTASHSTEPVLLYSDMPFIEMAEDRDFVKEWLCGMAAMLKKGLSLNLIHNIDRPIEEMMLGLESYIPMYMTGQITPYYLKDTNSGPFLHVLRVSGAAALAGEAIIGHQNEGRYCFTREREDLRYYRRRAVALLKHAAPLMEIYREDAEAEYQEFLHAEEQRGVVPERLDSSAFSNITIEVCSGRWAVVSKDRAPRIRFVIRHPKMVEAIEHFIAPVVGG